MSDDKSPIEIAAREWLDAMIEPWQRDLLERFERGDEISLMPARRGPSFSERVDLTAMWVVGGLMRRVPDRASVVVYSASSSEASARFVAAVIERAETILRALGASEEIVAMIDVREAGPAGLTGLSL